VITVSRSSVRQDIDDRIFENDFIIAAAAMASSTVRERLANATGPLSVKQLVKEGLIEDPNE